MWNGTLTMTNMGAGRVALRVFGSSLPIPVAQVVECPPPPFGEWEVTGSNPGRDIPKSLKMVLVAPRLAQIYAVYLELVDQVSG